MSAFAWLRRPCRPSSPPESSASAGRRPDTRRPASSSDSLASSRARAAAGVRHGALRLQRGLRPVLAAALLALPLLAGLTAGAEAQTVSISAPADADEGDSGHRDLVFTVSSTATTSSTIAYQVCFSGTATKNTSIQINTLSPADADYQPRNGLNPVTSTSGCVEAVSIHPGNLSSTAARIRVYGDTTPEPDETVIATLSLVNPPGGVTLGTSTATHTIVEDDLTLTLSVPDATAVEDASAADDAEIRVALSRALVSGETVAVPLSFSGGTRGTDFHLRTPNPAPAGVSRSSGTVTFTGPSAASVSLILTAAADADDTDDTVTVSLGTVTATGVTVASSTREGNGQVTLLEESPYTPSPGPPLVIVDRIVAVNGSCTGRECEFTEFPDGTSGNDIFFYLSLVRPALEKGVGLIPVEATEAIAVNAYVQPGVHAHQWVLAPGFAVGESTMTAILRFGQSTAVESDVRRLVMFSGPVGNWGEGNPPPWAVADNDPYYVTIKDGPDGSAGNVVPTVTVRQWHPQALDGGVAEGKPVHFEVMSPSPAQGPFTVHLKVGQTGNCLAPGNAKRHEVYFAPRVGSTVLTVPTVNDGTAEPDCTVRASLARADGTVPADGTVTTVVPAGSRFGYTIDTNGLSVGGHTFPHRAAAEATVRDDDSVARKVSFLTNLRQVRESTAGTVNLEVTVNPAPSASHVRCTVICSGGGRRHGATDGRRHPMGHPGA